VYSGIGEGDSPSLIRAGKEARRAYLQLKRAIETIERLRSEKSVAKPAILDNEMN